MPRPPRFRTEAIADLHAQLRYAPAGTRRRQMEAAERLLAQIDPASSYPQDFVQYRITGYRSDSGAEPVLLVGAALVADLAGFVARLSQTDPLPADHGGRSALAMDEVERRLRVSSKTIQRYRRQGLVCHYVRQPDGTGRLACFADALERFERAQTDRLRRAAGFSRIGDEQRRQIVDQARALRRDEALTLHAAAQRLARQHGRAVETLRMLLARHDRRSGEPIFTDAAPLTPRQREVIFRAWHFGVPASVLAQRFGKATSTIHHAINVMRRQRLQRLELRWIDLSTFNLPDCENVILAAPAVTSGLEDPIGGDVLALIERARAAEPPGEDLEAALLAGYNLLKRRARPAIDELPEYPAAGALDAIETDLRWAALLKRRLVALALPAALRAIELHLHRRLPEEPAEEILALVETALRVSASTVDGLDPARGRLARAAAYAVDRALAARPSRPGGRAAARHLSGSIRLDERRRQVAPWQTWLDPRPSLRERLGALDERSAKAMRRRYGWDGRPPMTLAQLAEMMKLTPGGIARLLRSR